MSTHYTEYGGSGFCLRHNSKMYNVLRCPECDRERQEGVGPSRTKARSEDCQHGSHYAICGLCKEAERIREALWGPSAGEVDVIAERNRQKAVEGWTEQHDDAHSLGELAAAGGCYALWAFEGNSSAQVPRYWPWDKKWWKPKTARRNLVRAAALILAEIESCDRNHSWPAESPRPGERSEPAPSLPQGAARCPSCGELVPAPYCKSCHPWTTINPDGTPKAPPPLTGGEAEGSTSPSPSTALDFKNIPFPPGIIDLGEPPGEAGEVPREWWCNNCRGFRPAKYHHADLVCGCGYIIASVKFTGDEDEVSEKGTQGGEG